MDAGADAATRAIAVVVAVLLVGGGSVVGRKKSSTSVAFRVKDVRVRYTDGIMVETPHVQNNGGILGDNHAIDNIVYTSC